MNLNYKTRKRFHILTYGCQMNDYDSRVIASILLNAGYKEINEIANADIIIVNTCSVREHAEQRALGRISDLQRLRKTNPDLLIGIVGCMAQNLGAAQGTRTYPRGVDFVVGPSNYKKLSEIIDARLRVGLPDVRQPTLNTPSVCLEESLETYSDILPEPDTGVSAFVPVMYGCSNFCSYCIVPYVRGTARSRPYQDILAQVEFLVAKGVKEITLLGQSVNEYQYNGVKFPQLLSLIDETLRSKVGVGGSRQVPSGFLTEEGLPVWIKFTTSHPKNMSLELIDAMKELQIKWIHLPVQSGSNKILTLMNRGYTKEEYLDWIYKTRSAIPGISITTDIIVGFPGEEEADFQQTLELVRAIRFDFAYMFKYSERDRTSACHMEPKLPEEVKSARLTELINTQNKITYEKNTELAGTIQEILVTGKSKDGRLWQGKTRQNKVVVFDGNASVGEFIKLKIKELRGWTPYGNINQGEEK